MRRIDRSESSPGTESMNRYRISNADEIYAAEFKRNLEAGIHAHSPGLQRILNVMRGGPKEGKYVLIIMEPHRRWCLGRMPASRGEPVDVLGSHEFTDLKEAEWTVFQLRWQEQTGEPLFSVSSD